jgi:ribosomal 30S subunit maturation factor RimM
VAWDDFVLVGRVARTHGHRGQVIVKADTDFVEDRFAPGATLWMLRDGRRFRS